MDWMLVRSLELHDKALTHQEIEPGAADGEALVLQRDRHLSLKRDSTKAELDCQRFLVHVLQEPGTQYTMDLEGRVHNLARERIDLRTRFLSVGVCGGLAVHFRGIGAETPTLPGELMQCRSPAVK